MGFIRVHLGSRFTMNPICQYEISEIFINHQIVSVLIAF